MTKLSYCRNENTRCHETKFGCRPADFSPGIPATLLKLDMLVKFPYVFYVIYINTFAFFTNLARGGAVVQALSYKPEGRGFKSRWCQWIFLLT
jgi:hypothetical protein